MSDSDGPRRRGRHSSADGGTGGVPASYWISGEGGTRDGSFSPGYQFPGYDTLRYEPSRYEPSTWTNEMPTAPRDAGERSTSGHPRVAGLLNRHAEDDETGPLVEPDWWAYGSSDHPDHPLHARHSEDLPGRGGSAPDDGLTGHPSAPLPPRPPGVWDRLHPRRDEPGDDAETVAQPPIAGAPLDSSPRSEETSWPVGGFRSDEDDEDAPHADPPAWEDQTGGLDVIGANVDEEVPRRRGRRRSRDADVRSVHRVAGDHPDAADPHAADDGNLDDDEIPVAPYDPRTGRARRRRRPFAVLISLLVLAGLVVGIVVGGQKLFAMIDPSSQDFTGQGTGSVEIRVRQGDTLSDIARTLVDAGVVASIGPFVDAAEADPASRGIQPGVYQLRQEMSGRAALDLLLDPVARLVSRVTFREGMTVDQTLQALADSTGTPVEELNALKADPAALGLPAYANGQLEGFLFPATYDFEPDDTPADMLRAMIARSQQALDALQIPVEQRLTVVTKASIVQAEAASAEDMGKVAQVLENRLADGMPLQLDTTVNYANGKAGITTTPQDRQNPSPYNTYMHAGLPPGAISNPGEQALEAVLAPTPGDWRFFVVVDPDTGETRFAVTAAEHQQNVLLFQQWLRENPEG